MSVKYYGQIFADPFFVSSMTVHHIFAHNSYCHVSSELPSGRKYSTIDNKHRTVISRSVSSVFDSISQGDEGDQKPSTTNGAWKKSFREDMRTNAPKLSGSSQTEERHFTLTVSSDRMSEPISYSPSALAPDRSISLTHGALKFES